MLERHLLGHVGVADRLTGAQDRIEAVAVEADPPQQRDIGAATLDGARGSVQRDQLADLKGHVRVGRLWLHRQHVPHCRPAHARPDLDGLAVFAPSG